MYILSLILQAYYLAITFLSLTSQAKEVTTSEMSLYLQDYSYSGGGNSTSVTVAGVSGKPRHFTEFGTVYVSDDLITLTPDPDSARVGRSQGTYVVASSDGRTLQVVLSLVFDNGSTVEIQGSYRQFEVGSEVSVVGGTGIFRSATGYATFETFSYHPSSNPNIPSHGVLRLNVTLVQVQC